MFSSKRYKWHKWSSYNTGIVFLFANPCLPVLNKDEIIHYIIYVSCWKGFKYYVSANREKKNSEEDIGAIAPDCTARSHCVRWKTQERDVIGQRAIRRNRARIVRVGRQLACRRGTRRRRVTVIRACALARCCRWSTVSNMAVASVIPSKMREKWRVFRAPDGAIVRAPTRKSVERIFLPRRENATAVPHHHGVGHSAAFPERVQFPAEFGEFSRVASSFLARAYAPRVAAGASCRRRRRRVSCRDQPSSITLYRRPGVASDSTPRDTQFRPVVVQLRSARLRSLELDRLGCLSMPYLAVHWQPCEKGNSERENSESSF